MLSCLTKLIFAGINQYDEINESGIEQNEDIPMERAPSPPVESQCEGGCPLDEINVILSNPHTEPNTYLFIKCHLNVTY